MAGVIRDYLIGLIILVAAMGGYQISVSKWLRPPEVNLAPIVVRTLTDNDQSLADLYPADAWQRGRSIRLKTQDGMLMFQNWEQNKSDSDGGKKWRLWPITLVIGRGLASEGAAEPILIEADDGAVIEFSSALDIMSGVAPEIQRGQLLGQVQIRRVSPQAVKSALPEAGSDVAAVAESAYRIDERQATLNIRTANVGIDRRKIWTTEPIHMQVGQAVMVGRDLTLHLAASGGSRASKSNLAGSLDRMELIYLRELTLPLNHGDHASGGEDPDRGVVQVYCDGRIEYDFALDQLLMDRNVRLVHRQSETKLEPVAGTPLRKSTSADTAIPPGHSTPIDFQANQQVQTPENDAVWLDRFECDNLRLTLRDPLNSDRIRETALDWIDRIEASGNPLTLHMKSQDFDLVAGQISFEPLVGQLIADGFDNAGKQPATVQVRRGGLQASLARIVYRFDPKRPRQLGTIAVDGGGQVNDVSHESVLQSMRWRRGLRVSPLDKPSAVAQTVPTTGTATDAMNVRLGVWCDDQIVATMVDGGTFKSDRIEGILIPISGSSGGTQGDRDSNLHARWFPDRFAAIGNVQVRSPTLRADTNQLNLFFEQQLETPATRDSNVTSSTEPSIRQWVSQPDTAAASSSNRPGAAVTPIKQPASIRGDQVTAKLTFGERALSATDLSVMGNVEVTHPMKFQSQPNAMLAVMTGDHLRLRDGGGSDVLQLGSQSNRAARLELGDGYFIGPEIQVRPDDNYIWIPAAGEFVVPSTFLPSIGGLDASGRSTTRWTQSPRCRFGGEMTFDGKLATLNGGVILTAGIAQATQPSEIQMRGDELRLTLDSAVTLRTPQSMRTTKLSQISLLQTSNVPVEVRVDRFATDGLRDSRHDLVVSELTWRPGENAESETSAAVAQANGTEGLVGEIVSPGPGSYRGWFRTPEAESEDETLVQNDRQANSRSASQYSDGLIEDNNPPLRRETQSRETITGVHLIYQDGMRGDLMSKSLTFSQGVRIGRRTVADFETIFEAADMDRLSQDEMTLDCDQIRLAIDPAASLNKRPFSNGMTPSPEVALEVEARGGVVFRSRTDRGLSEATADRCSYAVAKDLVTIEGIPGRAARFQQTNLSGVPVANWAIRSMTLRLRPFELISSQVESLGATMPPPNTSK